MALDTSVQPFIQNMLRQPDPKAAAAAIEDTIGGFAGAYSARKQIDREEDSKPKDQQMGTGERISKAFLGAQGQITEGATPFGSLKRRIYSAEASQTERQNSLDEQINKLIKDPIGLVNEVGNLPTDQIPDWLKKNAGITVNPMGQKIWSAVDSAYKQTTQAQISAGRSKHLGDLATKYPNLDLNTPDGLVQAQKNESVGTLYDRARGQGKLLNQLPDDWFNPDGTINDQKAVPGLGSLPSSERIQSAEEIANVRANAQREIRDARIQARQDMLEFRLEHGGGYTPGALQKDIDFIDKLNLPEDQKEMARNRRLAIEAKPAVERAPTSTGDYVKTRIDAFMRENPTEEIDVPSLSGAGTVKKTVPITRARAVTLLQEEHDRIYKSKTSTAPTSPKSSAVEVIRQTKDGRKAVFNSETKEFLRYAD